MIRELNIKREFNNPIKRHRLQSKWGTKNCFHFHCVWVQIIFMTRGFFSFSHSLMKVKCLHFESQLKYFTIQFWKLRHGTN